MGARTQEQIEETLQAVGWRLPEAARARLAKARAELAQMAGGLAYLTGLKDQPMRAGASITDIGAATYGVIGILSALYRREHTGVGDNIEAGLYETIVFWVSQYITGAQMSGVNPPPRGTRSATTRPPLVVAGVLKTLKSTSAMTSVSSVNSSFTRRSGLSEP